MSLTIKTMRFFAILLLLFGCFCSAVEIRRTRSDGAQLVFETGDDYATSEVVALNPSTSSCIKDKYGFFDSYDYQFYTNATDFNFKLCKKADLGFCWLYQIYPSTDGYPKKVGINFDCPSNDCSITVFYTVGKDCPSKNPIISTAMMVFGAPRGVEIGVYGVTFKNCGTTGIVGFGDSKTSKKKGHGSAANVRQTDVDGACLQAVALTTLPYQL